MSRPAHRSLRRVSLYSLPLALVAMVATALPAGAASPPALHITKGPYHDGQLINISVGPNHFYKPYSRINILECGDPGGKRANLPLTVNGCDGNTIQGNSILIAKNGSWSETGYQLYALPNVKSLGELADGQPACNQKKSCVLYVGENQENFTWPKQFSSAFTLRIAGKSKR